MILGVVLCGGQSRRMGQDKSQLRWKQQSWLAHTRDLLRQAGVAEVQICGGQAPGALVDHYPQCGPLGGIHSALRQHLGATGLLVMPVDMPRFAVENLRALIHFGSEHLSAAHFSGHHLPMFLPADATTLHIAEQHIRRGELALYRFLEALQAHAVPAPEHNGFENINSADEWRHLEQQQRLQE